MVYSQAYAMPPPYYLTAVPNQPVAPGQGGQVIPFQQPVPQTAVAPSAPNQFSVSGTGMAVANPQLIAQQQAFFDRIQNPQYAYQVHPQIRQQQQAQDYEAIAANLVGELQQANQQIVKTAQHLQVMSGVCDALNTERIALYQGIAQLTHLLGVALKHDKYVEQQATDAANYLVALGELINSPQFLADYAFEVWSRTNMNSAAKEWLSKNFLALMQMQGEQIPQPQPQQPPTNHYQYSHPQSNPQLQQMFPIPSDGNHSTFANDVKSALSSPNPYLALQQAIAHRRRSGQYV